MRAAAEVVRQALPACVVAHHELAEPATAEASGDAIEIPLDGRARKGRGGDERGKSKATVAATERRPDSLVPRMAQVSGPVCG